MTKAQSAALVMAQAAELVARVAGMQAENLQRTHTGMSMAYVEGDFLRAVDNSGCAYNDAITTFQNTENEP